MYEKLYEKIVDGLVDNGYIIINDALQDEVSSDLLTRAKSIKKYKQAGISASESLHQDANRRRDKIVWLDDADEVERLYLDFTQGLREYINHSLYLGLSYYEAHFALYEKGDFYEKHLDAFRGSKNRIVTTVFYLNEEWGEEDGGALIIYDEANQPITTVLPKANTLVVFLSDKFPHEVLPAKRKRHSIAGWFRVDKRDD